MSLLLSWLFFFLGVDSGMVLRLRGQGARENSKGGYGDLLVEIVVSK